MSNSVKIEIQNNKGNWCTWRNVVCPIKYGKLLDEQLDYAKISLFRIRKKEFKPLTKARITVTSVTVDGGTQSITNNYFVADDTYTESPVGSGIYNHEITLIELTKFLECFPLETLCFTNPSGNTYSVSSIVPELTISIPEESNLIGLDTYRTPSNIGTEYQLLNVNPTLNLTALEVIVTIVAGGETNTYSSLTYGENFSAVSFEIKSGDNVITYSYKDRASQNIMYYETFTIFGVQNHYPLKPWTVNEVIQRILQLVEPIRTNETPRFSFTPPTGEKAKLFSKIAPEFTFTRQTLREALQTVGGYIHAEPRLNEDNSISFDFYGEQEFAEYKNYKTNAIKRLNQYKYRTKQSSRSIEQATNKLDSYQDNLVNRLDWEQATTGQPFESGAQTLRTETAYIRGEENENYIFPSTQPVDKIVKFEYVNGNNTYDITPYVYEKTVYDNLSSYTDAYPSSKSYAVYYTQGSSGINGLFYKAPSAIDGTIGNNYSITNIINTVTGNDADSYNYETLQFRLTYVPIYSTRIQHGKQYINDYLPLPRTLNYTQSSNSVETQFFGENIKGAIERMGNAELNYTMNFRNLYNIPNAGLLWDKDYYISSVAVSVDRDLFEVTVGLSKNFNRKSNYIGASSYKRIYEVSETMVQQRHTVYTDYLIVTDSFPNLSDEQIEKIVESQENIILNATGLATIRSIFNTSLSTNEIVAVQAFGQEKGTQGINGSFLKAVLLPVISSAFGNVMEFTWGYKDNYSAGIKSEYKESTAGASGTFGQEVSYSNYYGRMYYYYFSLLSSTDVQSLSYTADSLPEITFGGQSYGQASVTMGTAPYIDRKDSRESEKKSYAIEIVTDNEDIVIGSAFASKNPLVFRDTTHRQPHLYVLQNRVNKYANTVDLPDEGSAYDLGAVSLTLGTDPLEYISAGIPSPVAGRAWVIAFPEYLGETITVSTEDGGTEPFTPELGGEVIFAKNVDVAVNDTVGDFSLIPVHNIYKYLEIKKGE